MDYTVHGILQARILAGHNTLILVLMLIQFYDLGQENEILWDVVFSTAK